MKKIVISLLSLFLITTSSIIAQTISGKVVDVQSKPIEFANIALFSLPDSTLITGIVTNERGEFSLNANTNSAFLQISFIGYETKNVPAITGQNIVLIAESTQLGEIVVRADNNPFRLGSDGIIASIRGTFLETLPTVEEMLKHLPFVAVWDNTYTVLGRGTPLIYINKRIVRDNNEILQLNPSNIRNIEVITAPGAEYDATVQSIIRITTFRPAGEGLSGSLRTNQEHARRYEGSALASLNYRSGALDLFGTLNGRFTQPKSSQVMTQQLIFSNNTQSNTESFQEQWHNNEMLFSTIGINYIPNTRHSIGIRYDWFSGDFTIDQDVAVEALHGGSTEKRYFFSKSIRNDRRHTLNGYYTGQLSDAVSLNINTDTQFGNSIDTQQISGEELYSEDISSQSNIRHSLYAVRGILNYTFGSNTLGAGTDFAYTNMKHAYQISQSLPGLENTGDRLSQNRAAAFATWRTQINKFGINAGIRYENIQMDYFENDVLVQEQSKIYNKLFPNLSVSYNSGESQMRLSYDMRVSYPSYSALASRVMYINSFMYESGNPLLKPAIFNTLSAMFSRKDIQTTVSLRRSQDRILMLPSTFCEENILLLRPENVHPFSDFTVGITYSPSIGIWRPQIRPSMQKQWLTLGELKQTYNTPRFFLTWNNTFSFENDWRLNVFAESNTAGHNGNNLQHSSWALSISAAKNNIIPNLNVSLGIMDIFQSYRMNWERGFDSAVSGVKYKLDSRRVQLIVTYSFNATQNRFRGQQSTDEINRL
jgi:hypothetical protein